MNKPKAIIFDLGKVIFDLSFDRTFEYWASASGKSVNEIKSKFIFDELFNKFERNDISPKEFRETISKRLGIMLSEQEFDNGWCSLYMDKYPGIDNLLLKLKSSYRIVALTNTNIIHDVIWRKKYAEVLFHFEKIFSSPELGTRKPEARIYEIVLNYLKLKPKETVFLDDNIDNVNGAMNVGIPSILVSSFEQMKFELVNSTTI